MTYINNINYFKILQHHKSLRVIVLIGELHTRDDCSNIGFNTPYGIGDLLTEIRNSLPRSYTPRIYIECPKIDPAQLSTPSVMFDICNMNQFQFNHLDNYTVDIGIDDRHELPELVEIFRLAIQPYYSGSTPDPGDLPKIYSILQTFKAKYYTFIIRKYNKTLKELMRSASIRRIIDSLKIRFENLKVTLAQYRNGGINHIDTLERIRTDLYPIILSGLDISIALRLSQNTDFTILYTGSDHCNTMSEFLFNDNNIWRTLYTGTVVGTNCITIDTVRVLNIMRSLPSGPHPDEVEMENVSYNYPEEFEIENVSHNYPVEMDMSFGYRKKNKSHTRSSFGRRLTSKRPLPKVTRSAPKVKRSPSPLRSSGPQSGPPEGRLLRSPRRSRGPILGPPKGRLLRSPVRLARFKRSPSPPKGRLLRSPRRSRGPILGPVRLARFKRSPSPPVRRPLRSPVRLARFKRSPIVRRSPLRKKKYDHGV